MACCGAQGFKMIPGVVGDARTMGMQLGWVIIDGAETRVSVDGVGWWATVGEAEGVKATLPAEAGPYLVVAAFA